MNRVRGALLGSASVLLGIGGALAADLPPRDAAPAAQFVRVCTAHGSAFFYVPGTDTCLRISGFVRVDALYVEPEDRAQDTIGTRARARLNIDNRTATEFGTLRALLRLEAQHGTGSFVSRFSEDDDTFGRPIGGEIESETELDLGFIEWRGFTAGLAQSFFDFYENELNLEDLRTSDKKLGLFAYTASFGEEFAASISFEDNIERRAAGDPFGGFPVIVGPGGELTSVAIDFAGARIPDIVGNLRLEQDWGEAELSAALHQVRTLNAAPAIFGPGGILVGGGNLADTEYGFAVQGGVKFNLPFLGEGDELYLQAAHAQGAVDYLGMSEITQIGGVIVNGVDGFVDPFGQVKLTEGFAALGAYVHYWTPEIRQSIFGGYARLDFPGSGQAPVIDPVFGLVNVGLVDFDEVRLGTNVFWQPVEQFEIGAEIFYTRLDPKGRIVSAPIFRGPEGFEQRSVGVTDNWIARLRIEREF